MTTIITDAARNGYSDAARGYDHPVPYIAATPAWYGSHAGKALHARGSLSPVKATMGRGHSVNIETAATRFVAKFGVALPPTIERKD